LLIVSGGRIRDYVGVLIDQFSKVGTRYSSPNFYLFDTDGTSHASLDDVREFVTHFDEVDLKAIRHAFAPLERKILAAYRLARDMQKADHIICEDS
jgi:hypothetical protein